MISFHFYEEQRFSVSLHISTQSMQYKGSFPNELCSCCKEAQLLLVCIQESEKTGSPKADSETHLLLPSGLGSPPAQGGGCAYSRRGLNMLPSFCNHSLHCRSEDYQSSGIELE